MATVLVVGGNRGIGLELCRQYADRGDDVIAACRHENTDLESLGARVIDNIDVADDRAVNALAEALDDRSLDVLIHNAGILQPDTIDTVDFDAMLEHFRVNSIGPLRVIRALRSKLRDGARIGIVTSRVGSIDDNSSGGNYAYRVSKTAANMIGKNLSHDLAPRGIAVALLHPGYVRTDMTGGSGMTDADESARGLIARMDAHSMETTGTFWHAEGYQLPW